MRYVNPLVEGSSPSPVTKAQSTGNTQETLRNERFSMRSRPETTLLSSHTETNENDAERPPVTTQITTRKLPDDPDLAIVIEAWDRLPEGVRQSVVMLVKAASGK